MIWDSVALMTAFDVLIVGTAVYAGVALFRGKMSVPIGGTSISYPLIFAGIAAIAALYLADFATMHVLPYFMPKADSMGIRSRRLSPIFTTSSLRPARSKLPSG